MNPSASPAFSLRRASLRASTRLAISLVVSVIGLAAVTLCYELRHPPGVGKNPAHVKLKMPKKKGGKVFEQA